MLRRFYLEETDFYCSICGDKEDIQSLKSAEIKDEQDRHIINICPTCKGALIDALTIKAKPEANVECKIDGCHNPIKARSMCEMHYQRFRRHGDPLYVTVTEHSCKVEGCDKERKAKGYCYKHLYRFNKYGDPLHKLSVDGPRICKYNGCDREVHARGYCHKHVAWLYRGKLTE